MPDLLFEVGTEELPSWYVTQGSESLAALMRSSLEEANLGFAEIRSYATPRRLAVIVSEVDEASPRRTEKRRGPPESAAFDQDGKLTKAALGFARSNGVEADGLTVEDTDRGRYLFASREVGGEAALELLPPILTNLVANLSAPRKMRWGEVETPFVRPVAWLLALLGNQPIDFEVAGQRSGTATRGHRFLAPDEIVIRAPGDYLPALEGAYVIPGEAERRDATREAVSGVARREGLAPDLDPALLAEVTNLVETPFAILGSFDEAYLELPDEVLATVMIHHQRFFPVRREGGPLAAHFVAVSNNRVPDEGVVRLGYEKVLAGRLYDASFFWRADREKSLSQHAWELSGIQFHRKLGSMADKVARVGEIARELATRLDFDEGQMAVLDRSLPIYRADLGTGMVFEFPELEGVMARAYALAEGMPEEVGRALEGGVKPRGPEDSLPDTEVGALLSAGDRADKLLGFIAAGLRGSGSADPYGLRRDALGLVRILAAQGWQLAPRELFEVAAGAYAGATVDTGAEIRAQAEEFVWDRVSSLLFDEGLSVHVVRAACADRPPVITAARRAHLLDALAREEEFPALLTLYKRAANLAEKAPEGVSVDPDRFREPQEAPLYEALPAAREGMSELLSVAREHLHPWDLGHQQPGALPSLDAPVAKILQLKQPLDSFLDDVLVMVEDEELRDNRLALLVEVRETLGGLGRLEELEGV